MSFFANNPNYQQYSQYANNYGSASGLNDQQVAQDYTRFAQNVSPQEFQQAHEQAFQQMPPQQRQGLMDHIMGFMGQNNMNPQQAGIQYTDPQHANYGNPQDLSRAMGHVAQQQPDALQQMLGPGGALNNPLVKIGAVGALAFAASKFLGNK